MNGWRRADAHCNTLFSLTAGQTLDFAIGSNGGNPNDNTAFNATITAIPEPTTLGLLSATALTLVRRRRA